MISLIVGCSLLWSIITTNNNPAGAYFSSFTRAWQLGLGALLALLLYSRQSEISLKVRQIFSFTGVIVISYSCINFDSNTAFPGYLALLPTLGAAGLIAAGSNSANNPLPNKILSLRPATFIGRISYSLYLWHWPLIILLTYKFSQNEASIAFRSLMLLVILGVSVLSFYFIEKPIRDIKVPESLKAKYLPPENQAPRSKSVLIKYAISATVVLVSFAMVISLLSKDTSANLTTEQIAAIEKQAEEATKQNLVAVTSTPYTTLLAKWKSEVTNSANLLAIPKTMDPPLSRLLSDRGLQWNQCMGNGANVITCEFGNLSAKKTAIILGDSFALAIYPTVLGALDLTKWHVIGLNYRQCMIANVIPIVGGKPDDSCASHRKWAYQYAIAAKPNLLVLSDNTNNPISLNGEELIAGRQDYWKNALDMSLKQLSGSGAEIYYFGQPPNQKPLTECTDAQQNLTASCLGRPSGNVSVRAVQKEVSDKYGVNFINIEEWICAGNNCPPVIANTPVFWDGGHFSKTFAAKMAPLFKALLAEKNIF